MGTTEARLLSGDVSTILQEGVGGAEDLIMEELSLDRRDVGQLNPATRWNLQKVLRYKSPTLIGDIAERLRITLYVLYQSLLSVILTPLLRIFCWRNLS